MPKPNLASFVPANYTVVSTQSVPLVKDQAPAVVVTSATSTHGAVPGATGDVQVLVYDALAKRWNLTFDAATPVSAGGESPSALLNQSDPLSHIAAVAFHPTGSPVPDLVISAEDASTNHPSYTVGIIHFSTGASTLIWRNDVSQMVTTTPVITGPAAQQRLTLTAIDAAVDTPASTPLRNYTQVLTGTSEGQVAVSADDRSYAGLYLAEISAGADTATTSGLPAGAAIVTAVDPKSSAAGVLRRGDLVLTVNGSTATTSSSVLDKLATAKAGTTVTVGYVRGATTLTSSIKLASQLRDPQQPSSASDSDNQQFGSLGVQADSATLALLAVITGGPAQAAGLQIGDTLTSVNGVTVSNFAQLAAALWNTAGTPIRVSVKTAAGGTHDVTLTPQPAPEGSVAANYLIGHA